MSFFTRYKSGYKISVKLIPGAKCSEIREVMVDAGGEFFLKISLNAIPEKGRANKELLKFLAEKLHFPKQNFSIISGVTDHYKKIYLQAPQTEENDHKLRALIKENA